MRMPPNPTSQSSPNRRLRQAPITDFVRDAAQGVGQGLQRLRGADGADGGENEILSPILPTSAQKRSRSSRENDSMTTMTSRLGDDEENPETDATEGANNLATEENLEEAPEMVDGADGASSTGSEPPRRRQRNEETEIRNMESGLEALDRVPNGEERPVATIPVHVSGGADMTRAGEERNINGSLGAIPRIRGIEPVRARQFSSTDFNWDTSADVDRSLYREDDFDLEDEEGPAMDHDYEEESEEMREAVAASREATVAARRHGAGGGQLGAGAPGPVGAEGAGAEDRHTRLIRMMTQKMSTLGNDFAGIREDLGELSDLTIEARDEARDAFEKSDEAEARAQEAVAVSAQTERSLARVQEEVRQRFEAQDARIIQGQGSLESKIEELRTFFMQRLQVVEERAQGAALNAEGATAAPAQIDGETMDVIKALIKKHHAEENRYWRSTILVTGVRTEGPHTDAYTQARAQLRAVGLLPLAEDCVRTWVTSTGNVRCTFNDPGEAQRMLKEAKRALGRTRNNRVRVEILVPPKDVTKKNCLNRLGRELKTSGRCDNYEIISRGGRILLKTYSRASGSEVHDLEQDGAPTAEADNCGVCLDTLSNGEVVKIKGCNHRFHLFCAVLNWLHNGLSCPLCRQMPSTVTSWEAVSCVRCLPEFDGEQIDPRDLRVSTCGHLHRSSCMRDFFRAKGRIIEQMRMEDLREFSRGRNESPCYECTVSGRRPRWVPAIAVLESLPEARLRRVEGPRAQRLRPHPDTIMEAHPGWERGRQARLQRDRDTPVTPATGPNNVERSSSGGRGSVRRRDDDLAIPRTLRQRLEREAGYTDSPAARLRVPPRDPRSGARRLSESRANARARSVNSRRVEDPDVDMRDV